MQEVPRLRPSLQAVCSAWFNGNSVVNVVTTGTFTIPLMKTLGIQPYVAGAVEAAASTAAS
jgi:TRAP-type uncharacterized transport system fused permease subunit